MDFFNNDEEEDDYFLEPTEAERWFDDHLGYFKWLNRNDGFDVPLDYEMFFYSVYKPFNIEKRKPLLEFVHHFFPYIKAETRPEVLAKLDRRIEYSGTHELIKLLCRVEQQKTGKDIREFEPDFDKQIEKYKEWRKPSEPMEGVLMVWKQADWLTDEQREALILDYKQELEEYFIFEENRRSRFFDAIQSVLFKLYPAIQDLDNDGWIFYFSVLYYEYLDFWIDMEELEAFIEYGFHVEDLNLPNHEYREELNKRISAKLDAEREERIKKLAEEEAKKKEAGE
jgi:hypothetical protein